MFCFISPDRLAAERRSPVEQNCKYTLSESLLKLSEETKEGESIMGSVSELVSAMAALGILRAWNAREEEKICKQEEEFVPFRFPPLPQQEQVNPLPIEEAMPEVAMATSAPHAH
jgi:hypothetical protein